MARPAGIQYAGATCHVMARGNQGRAIYADDRHRERWLETLAEAWVAERPCMGDESQDEPRAAPGEGRPRGRVGEVKSAPGQDASNANRMIT
jgi:hypothetical protein